MALAVFSMVPSNRSFRSLDWLPLKLPLRNRNINCNQTCWETTPVWSVCNQSLEIQRTMAWQPCWCTITKGAKEKPLVKGTPTWRRWRHVHTPYQFECVPLCCLQFWYAKITVKICTRRKADFAKYFHAWTWLTASQTRILKVHLTPKFFSLSNKFCCHFEHFVTKSFWFGLIPDFLCAVEIRKIGRKYTPFWFRSSSEGMGLVTSWRQIKNSQSRAISIGAIFLLSSRRCIENCRPFVLLRDVVT